jgi:L-rhamnose isomerase/sugar isomerase
MDLSAAQQDQYEALAADLARRGIDAAAVRAQLKKQHIETPSWGYGNSGTRFGVFRQAGAARDVHERLQDAAEVHRLTGVCPSVALHIPWDKVADFAALTQEASALGVRIGAINPNLFQDPAYELGSFGHHDPAVRAKATEHVLECVEVMRQTGSPLLSLWFADGTNYAGQADVVARKHWFEACLQQTHAALPDNSRMLVEYKFFEPAFYHTDIADWGMALSFACKAGPKAEVLVDLGHHAQGTNIEHIVAFLIDEGRLGGFHFNNRKYADDDLTIGSVNPYEVFLIYNEIVAAACRGVCPDIAYMIDQSHTIKSKVEAMIQSVLNIQAAYAKSLLVDRAALAAARSEADAVRAEEILKDAYDTDVRPLLASVRAELGAAADPLAAYRASGYFERIAAARAGALEGAASWG